MDKADPNATSGIVVQQTVQQIIAYKSTGTVGHGSRDPGGLYGSGHCGYRNRREVGGWAMGIYKFTPGLIAVIVGDPGIPDVDCDPLRRDGAAAAGLTDAKDGVRLYPGSLVQHPFTCKGEDSGDLQFT